jgi:hypothetical protein
MTTFFIIKITQVTWMKTNYLPVSLLYPQEFHMQNDSAGN